MVQIMITARRLLVAVGTAVAVAGSAHADGLWLEKFTSVMTDGTNPTGEPTQGGGGYTPVLSPFGAPRVRSGKSRDGSRFRQRDGMSFRYRTQPVRSSSSMASRSIT